MEKLDRARAVGVEFTLAKVVLRWLVVKRAEGPPRFTLWAALLASREG